MAKLHESMYKKGKDASVALQTKPPHRANSSNEDANDIASSKMKRLVPSLPFVQKGNSKYVHPMPSALRMGRFFVCACRLASQIGILLSETTHPFTFVSSVQSVESVQKMRVLVDGEMYSRRLRIR